MVEAERRAETKRMAYQLEEVGKRSKQMNQMRAERALVGRQQVAPRGRLCGHARRRSCAAECGRGRGQAPEERVAKLQDERQVELAMWRRERERGAGATAGGGGGTAARRSGGLTWAEAEKAMREGERWKAVARRSEDAVRLKEEENLHMKVQLEETKMSLDKRQQTEAFRARDDAPLEEMKMALLSAQDDLQSKTDEASALAAKVNRLELALRQVM